MSVPPALTSARALVQGLLDGGVRHVCVCPGARSAPLAWALAEQRSAGRLTLTVHHDERSAGFFALGVARMQQAPVGLVCTSGSAVANFAPAVVEAFASHLPLVLLTADRPPELQDRGAPQAMDQHRFFGTHVRWFHDVGAPSGAAHEGQTARRAGARAAWVARGAGETALAGPVHLNVPFREPLTPSDEASPVLGGASAIWEAATGERTGVASGAATALAIEAMEMGLGAGSGRSMPAVERLAAAIAEARRPLLVVGAMPGGAPVAPSLVSAAGAAGVVLAACALSGLRTVPEAAGAVVAHADVVARDAGLRAELAPDLIVRLGAPPTSKALGAWIAELGEVPLVLCDPAQRWWEPGSRAVIHTAIDGPMLELALRRVAGDGSGDSLGSGSDVGPEVGTNGSTPDPASNAAARRIWRERWLATDARVASALASALRSPDVAPPEAAIMAAVIGQLRPGDTLHVASSMPVRDLDHVCSAQAGPRITSNRGVNGIDGTLSTACGQAWVEGQRAAAAGTLPGRHVVVLGDVATLHDLTGLVNTRLPGVRLTVVVVNNDGGGIFGFLPINNGSEAFEQFFSTPHGMDFSAAAQQFGLAYRAVQLDALTVPALASALAPSVDGAPESELIEVFTARGLNLQRYRALWPGLLAAARGEG